MEAATPPPPPAPPPPAPGTPDYPVTFDVEYPEHLSHWKVLVKWLFAIPQFIIVYLLQAVNSVIIFIAFFAVLFTKKWPRGLFDFSLHDPAVDVQHLRLRAGAAARRVPAVQRARPASIR